MHSEGKKNRTLFRQGIVDGTPIGLVYFAVAVSLGINAHNVGMTAIQGFIMSLTTIASAGEYGGVSIMAAGGTWAEMVILTIVVNIRYILMACALSQKMPEGIKLREKLGIGFFITDEIFAIQIARPGKLDKRYTYGAAAVAVPMWALGTTVGIIAGNIMPARLVSALSVALYGMFVGIVIPPAKADRAVLISVIASYVLSWGADRFLTMIPSGTQIIILIVLISAAAAVLFPREEEAANA